LLVNELLLHMFEDGVHEGLATDAEERRNLPGVVALRVHGAPVRAGLEQQGADLHVALQRRQQQRGVAVLVHLFELLRGPLAVLEQGGHRAVTSFAGRDHQCRRLQYQLCERGVQQRQASVCYLGFGMGVIDVSPKLQQRFRGQRAVPLACEQQRVHFQAWQREKKSLSIPTGRCGHKRVGVPRPQQGSLSSSSLPSNSCLSSSTWL
jgi:hypothetical protein